MPIILPIFLGGVASERTGTALEVLFWFAPVRAGVSVGTAETSVGPAVEAAEELGRTMEGVIVVTEEELVVALLSAASWASVETSKVALRCIGEVLMERTLPVGFVQAAWSAPQQIHSCVAGTNVT